MSEQEQARLFEPQDAGPPKQERCQRCGQVGLVRGACVRCGAGTEPSAPTPRSKRKSRGRMVRR